MLLNISDKDGACVKSVGEDGILDQCCGKHRIENGNTKKVYATTMEDGRQQVDSPISNQETMQLLVGSLWRGNNRIINFILDSYDFNVSNRIKNINKYLYSEDGVAEKLLFVKYNLVAIDVKFKENRQKIRIRKRRTRKEI
uniref:Uncharacterized protein n=1 Tax=Romanomermis culicivorax TaxID=13658 RepID=A0A915JAG8_ROMCU